MRCRVSAALFLFAACSPYGSTQSDGPAPTTDAGADASDAATSEDAPSNADANAGDAGGDVDAGACPVVFDEHFDSKAPVGWESTETNGTLASNGGDLVASVNAGSGTAYASLKNNFSYALPKTAVATFGVQVPSSSSGYAEVGCTFSVRNAASSYYALFLALSSGSFSLEDEASLKGATSATGAGASIGVVDAARRYRVRYELRDLSATGAHVLASVDDIVLMDRVVTFPDSMQGLTVACGAYATTPTTADVRIDGFALAICE